MKGIVKALSIFLFAAMVMGIFMGSQTNDGHSPAGTSAQESDATRAGGGKASEEMSMLSDSAGDSFVIATMAPLARTPAPTLPESEPPTHGEARIDQPDISARRGQRDDVVASMQRLLIHYGYLTEGSADGIFGRNTEQAVTRFQEINGLWVTGVIDGETYDALYSGVIPEQDASRRAVIPFSADARPMFTPSPSPTKGPTATPKRTNTPRPTATPASYDAYDDDAEMVWIPRSGKRYHDSEYCSNMKNPRYVTIQEAKRRGFTPCKKCY